ncbi:MAG: YdcF family protein, partial [Anaerolineaceae bacterium]|nr:YdcF family protein [Anaerolineaceae bacterium]
LLLIAFLLLTRKHTQGRNWRWMIIMVLMVIFLGGNRWVPAILARSLEWRYLPPENLPKDSMVVLLGGGTESLQYPRQMTETYGAGDRVLYSARLYQSGVAGRILLSGGNIEWSGSRTTTPAQDMAELLLMMGVPENILILQDQSRNTAEDALFSAEILRKRGVNEIILVTSASHMMRSVGLFEKQGFTVIPAPVDYSITYDQWNSLWKPTIQELLVGLVPNADNLSDVTYVLKEYIGLVVYRVRGWL